MVNSNGALTKRSMAMKARKTYCGPIRSQMMPETRAMMELTSILENRVIPSHRPIWPGGTKLPLHRPGNGSADVIKALQDAGQKQKPRRG